MKRQVILSLLAVVALLAVSTSNAEAGMFGRLHVLKGGCCTPCEPAACEPCQPACEPCVPACEPCVPACEPACCEPCCDVPCARGPFRPFGGFFLGLKHKLAVKQCAPCDPCGTGCEPCVPACEPCQPACEPCVPACEPACCEPACCEPACGPCGAPFRPFGGFFANAWAKAKAKSFACNPCGVACDPCEPVCEPCEPACDPCHPCK